MTNQGRDKELEDDDPMELIGFVMDAEDETMMIEMGRTFIDEFMRMGYPNDAIMDLFKDAFYRAPHTIYLKKGEAFVQELLESARKVHTARIPR